MSCLCPLSISIPVKRSITAKSLQFNTEPPKETESQSLECPVPSSFSYLIGQMAETAEEKYRLLEQKDKVLRQGEATSSCGPFSLSTLHEQAPNVLPVTTGRPKRTDLDMSKVFVGTCPDMCPEKERFMRETRKQLSVFEVIPDTEMVCLFISRIVASLVGVLCVVLTWVVQQYCNRFVMSPEINKVPGAVLGS